METASVTDIDFIHLGIRIKNLRSSISVFGFEIAFYGLIIGLGIAAGILLALWDAKKDGQKTEDYLDFACFAIIFSIVGARIYYVVFAWEEYRNNLWQAVNIRAGGMAIYGGVIGAALTLLVFTKRRKLSFFKMADSGCLGLLLGQIIGRWGNFVNCEAFGGYTDGPFAMRIRRALVNPSAISDELLNHLKITDGIEYIQVHPTFLYESLWNLGVLLILLVYRRNKAFDGELFFLYLAGYGLGRVWIEGLRTDQLTLFSTGIAVSQLLAGILIIVSLITIVTERQKV